MNLQESGEMYLETIFILSKTNPHVRSIDVVEYMGFSKPSVSRAIGLLRSGGYVNMDKDGYLTLTEAGYEVADKMYERHRLISGFLTALGVSEETATADACKIEHHISDESFEAIKKFVEGLKQD
ncbi:MAG: metal-dependent transcriptional regulator [Clostridia bacterium]|nr:metal-dependent transcriptional regulator [Clostridia bacterium]